MPSDRRFVMKSDVWNGLASITDFGSALCRSMNISVLTTRRISGPGIKAVQEIIHVPELQAALGKRDEQEYEYPLGLDFFVLDQWGCLMGIPRKTRIESR